MKERYYDLNGRDNCVFARIEIADRTFRISRVVIAARVLYSNHLQEMGNLLKKVSAFEEKKERNPEDSEALFEEVNLFAQRKMETYEKVIRLLLEKNGYEYVPEWWDENTDEADRRTFIEKCMMKDSEESKKKDQGK